MKSAEISTTNLSFVSEHLDWSLDAIQASVHATRADI